MKKAPQSFVTFGITSMFLIFSVLCLMILALLTWGTSRSDLKMSQLSLEQTKAYYEACDEAAGLCLQAEDILAELARDASGEEEYYSSLDEALSGISQAACKPDTRTLLLTLPVQESQLLCVELEISYPINEGDTCLTLLTWKTQASDNWNADTKQPVYKGETS